MVSIKYIAILIIDWIYETCYFVKMFMLLCMVSVCYAPNPGGHFFFSYWTSLSRQRNLCSNRMPRSRALPYRARSSPPVEHVAPCCVGAQVLLLRVQRRAASCSLRALSPHALALSCTLACCARLASTRLPYRVCDTVTT